MGAHLIGGEFQSDRYPTCPPGKVPLSVKDTDAQDLLWLYAERHRTRDAEFSDDVQEALRLAGYQANEMDAATRCLASSHLCSRCGQEDTLLVCGPCHGAMLEKEVGAARAQLAEAERRLARERALHAGTQALLERERDERMRLQAVAMTATPQERPVPIEVSGKLADICGDDDSLTHNYAEVVPRECDESPWRWAARIRERLSDDILALISNAQVQPSASKADQAETADLRARLAVVEEERDQAVRREREQSVLIEALSPDPMAPTDADVAMLRHMAAEDYKPDEEVATNLRVIADRLESLTAELTRERERGVALRERVERALGAVAIVMAQSSERARLLEIARAALSNQPAPDADLGKEGERG